MPLFVPLVVASDAATGSFPTFPFVVAQLAEFYQEDGSVRIGPHLMSAREIDEFVDRMLADVEAFRRMAKHELDLALSRSQPR
jgi:hypothetical protein